MLGWTAAVQLWAYSGHALGHTIILVILSTNQPSNLRFLLVDTELGGSGKDGRLIGRRLDVAKNGYTVAYPDTWEVSKDTSKEASQPVKEIILRDRKD